MLRCVIALFEIHFLTVPRLTLDGLALNRNEHINHSNTLEAINIDLMKISTAQKACDLDLRTVQSTVGEIKDTSANLSLTSARMADITTETYTKVNELIHNAEEIRTMSQGIELAAQSLAQERFDLQPMILETFKGEVNRTISRTLKTHLKKHFGPPKENQRQANSASDSGGQSQPALDTGTASESQRCQSEDKDSILPQGVLEHLTDKWIKKSFSVSQRDLISNTMFGNLSIRTTTILYIQERDKGLQPRIKEVCTTTLTFLPSPWLLSQGILLKHQRSKFLGEGGYQGIPHWTLSTVHIVEPDSEIIKACEEHDLETIRNLFEKGRASPYDVDADGRNLLGHTAVGVQVSTSRSFL